MKPNVIDSFKGEYEWLSNFYHHPLEFHGETWISAEHAYQAMKTLDFNEREHIRKAPHAGVAKKLGRSVTLRPDWEDVKLQMMLTILQAKFRDPVLREKLLATGDAELIEGNWWGDTFWGVCRGKGQNQLGRLLMSLRELLRDENAR
jgi:ribA/ribD-fused uncharacterized protein